VKTASLALALACTIASHASAATFDAYYGFGDSTLDSGWWAGALNGQCGLVASPCATGFTNKDARISAAIANGGTGAPVGAGQMSSQFLAADFGLTATPANQPNGTNYAISGSLSARVGGSASLNANNNLPSTVEQIADYLTSHSNIADPNGIYEISSGGNDRTYAADNFLTPADRETFLSGQASALADAIHDLAAAGAQTILVRGASGTGTLPTFWTNALFSDLTTLSVNFIEVDMVGLVQAVVNNPTAYGFTAATVLPGVAGDSNPSSACVGAAGQSGWGQWCADTTTADPNSDVNMRYSELRSLDAEQTSFYSDNEHFSAAGQKIVADYEYALLSPTPLPATLPLFGTGLGTLGLLAWRKKRKQRSS
jgi:outer membrane lipase/esterase